MALRPKLAGHATNVRAAIFIPIGPAWQSLGRGQVDIMRMETGMASYVFMKVLESSARRYDAGIAATGCAAAAGIYFAYLIKLVR